MIYFISGEQGIQSSSSGSRISSATSSATSRPGKGLLTNDVMQAGGEGSHFCDTMYEGLTKTENLLT